jgi:hypothetical protein
MDDNRPFPIQQERKRNEHGEMETLHVCTIPWWLAEEAYAYYSSKFGKSQSLETLAARGGFGRYELLLFLRREAV